MDAYIRERLLPIWDYMHMNMALAKADCIVGFGCYNDDIPLRCAELYHQGWAPKVLFTGGLGRNTRELWTESEAARFGRIALAQGVPEKDLILEDKATNSAENILFTREKLRSLGLPCEKLIGVHKPFMERRVYAAMKVYWPEAELIVTSPQLDLDKYIARSVAQGLSEQTVIDVIVGDFQRMEVYAERGYQIPQVIPDEQRRCFAELVAAGCTSELVT
ncbi:MAG: YdcF family protein [Candidatus Limivicinus sp.]|nr:YdcF family protein [Clostridiales bacterium]MCI7136439.1 YdcF family protein [Clostridiales bacterium]MDY6132702.1 YdcF family protein [Candidatus Limivicinus sp.]